MTRGGKRPGAGRKTKQKKRVMLSTRVAQETKAELSDMAKAGNTSIGRVIDNLVNDKRRND